MLGIPEHKLPGLNLFKLILHTAHPNLQFPKKTKLGVCTTCTQLRSRKIFAKTDIGNNTFYLFNFFCL